MTCAGVVQFVLCLQILFALMCGGFIWAVLNDRIPAKTGKGARFLTFEWNKISIWWISYSFAKLHLKTKPTPEIPAVETKWFGKDARTKEDTSVRPFKISVDEKDLSDLKTRLKLDLERGITPPLEDAGFAYGFNGDYLRQG